jgi:hypothetical protein
VITNQNTGITIPVLNRRSVEQSVMQPADTFNEKVEFERETEKTLIIETETLITTLSLIFKSRVNQPIVHTGGPRVPARGTQETNDPLCN